MSAIFWQGSENELNVLMSRVSTIEKKPNYPEIIANWK
jgi:hypothetical protein